MNRNPTVIYLTGKPGVGKYTIAKELFKNYGFIVCDHQLINNPIFELLQYGGCAKAPDFAWDSITKIRKEVFKFLTKLPKNNYVLTNNLYEDEGDKNLYEQVKNMAKKRGSLFVPVKLLVNQNLQLKRITHINRHERREPIDPQNAHDKTSTLNFTHPNMLELEISNLSPVGAADRIMHHISSLM